jgi:hypothetical protein
MIGLASEGDDGRSTVEHPEPDHHADDRDVQRPGYDQPDRAEPPSDQHEVERAQQQRGLRHIALDHAAGLGQKQIAAAGLEGDDLRQPVEHIQAQRQADDRQAEHPGDHGPDPAEPPADQDKIERADEQPRPVSLWHHNCLRLHRWHSFLVHLCCAVTTLQQVSKIIR